MKTSEKIIEYLKIKKQVSTKELVDYLGLSRMAVFNQLNNLLADGRIVKTGRPPKVFYALAEKKVS
jgi:predicted ArsR family transcriptional regulator